MDDIDRIEDEMLEAIARYEVVTLEGLGSGLRSLYYGFDEFSLTGQDHVPELSHWVAARIVDRIDSFPDGLMVIRQVVHEIHSALEQLDKEGLDAVSGGTSQRPTGARGG